MMNYTEEQLQELILKRYSWHNSVLEPKEGLVIRVQGKFQSIIPHLCVFVQYILDKCRS